MAVALLSGALAACSPIIRNYGYVPLDRDLEQIVVGVDTRATVGEVIGSPQASGVIRGDAWYYVASTQKTVGYRAPEVVDRQVVAISFAPDGTVRNIERFGLEEGRVVTLNRRVTDDNVKGVSFIRQLMGNLGNFRADDVID
ncbi:outer membrane protein assembly factor BamE [Rhodovulum adriaticum]|nr:outer membrane protein assembly factor BamE [Rhodovulum adriaticum]MBK1635946.1 cell envelope protein SmpA [Rhodovulum adriaticum]